MPENNFTIADNIGLNCEKLDLHTTFPAVSGVRFTSGGTVVAETGNASGYVVTIECPWGTTALAKNILERIGGKIYQPYDAQSALVSPGVDLGDVVNIADLSVPVFRAVRTLDGLAPADISAPYDDALEHKYPVPDATYAAAKKAIKEEIKEIIDPETEDIQDDIDDIKSDLDDTKDDIDDIQNTLDTPEILGPLTTEALYALYGDSADLLVDRLSTSRRIPRYLRQDTSDDNFVKIENERVDFYAGICDADAAPVQASDPDGAPLFWKSDPDADGASVGSNGYPVDADGKPIYTTTDQTDWPIYIYQYTDQLKASFSFELEKYDAKNIPIYTPTITLGAGNAQGTNIAKITKGTEGFDLTYLPVRGDPVGFSCTTDGRLVFHGSNISTKISLDGDDENAYISHDSAGNVEFLRVQPQDDNTENSANNVFIDGENSETSAPTYTPPASAGMKIGSDGYADLVGARRSTHINFSNFLNGSFSETVDGDSKEYVYKVEFEDDDRPVKITAFDGHECTITWPEDL